MSKVSPNIMLDGALAIVAGGNIQYACSSEPADRAAAIAAALADVAMVGGNFVIADGDTSGRKLTVAEKTGVTVDADGTANHIAVCDGTDLLYVTTCTSQALTSGNTMTFPSWKIELADPS